MARILAFAIAAGPGMITAALAIFVKTPHLSPVKTRLAVGIGTEAATVFYQHCLHCLEELALHVMARTNGEIQVYWAVGEKDGLDSPLWGKLPRIWTGDGGLGERLYHVYSTLVEQHGCAMLMGSDSPHLRPDHVLRAHALLQEHGGQVIGPAEDGGYYLFGGHTQLPRAVWLNIPYSSQHTCSRFASALAGYGPLHFLAQDFDVDSLADLAKLKGRAMTSPAQAALMHWLNTHAQTCTA